MLIKNNTFGKYLQINLSSVLRIRYSQWKTDIQCKLNLDFYNSSMNSNKDYGLRPRHYLIYFSVLDVFPFLWISVCLASKFCLEQPFHTGITFLSFYIKKIFMPTFTRDWWPKINSFVKSFLRVHNCSTSCK